MLRCIGVFPARDSSVTTDLLGKRLGDFEIVRELGRGGMGVVYEARQTSLNRRVALKVLGASLGLTSRAVDRFRREAAAAARLHHTNIVPVYATGEQEGVHFYAMELIDGPSLDNVIRQMHAPCEVAPTDQAVTGPYVPSQPTPTASGSASTPSSDRFDRAAAMVADVADALHHAHQQGVTHRDVKPSNLLLSSDGRLSVTDFGLARMLEQPGMTVTGEFVGTPAYMSPEQVTAGRIPVDHRTDIYSLGATLYELLTLRPPFRADGRDKLLALVVQKEPPAPRSLDPKVPRDLETICLKCLEKDPDRRYPTAKALADDLRRYLNRFAIQARRAGPFTRLKKWVKRNPALSAAGLALLIAVAAAAFFAWQAHRSEQRRLADEQRRDDEAMAEKRQAAIEKAMVEAMSGDAPLALEAITEAENSGAEPGTLHMLRGLVERHRGRSKEAIVHLQQGERQLPDSVAVKALLAVASADVSQYVRSETYALEAGRLAPQKPEDYLFLGLAQSETVDPAVGMRTLDEAPARARQSTVARLIRGMVQTGVAFMTGRAEDAERALDILQKVDLPDDHPLLLRYRLQAHMILAQAWEKADPARAEQAWKLAARDAERLKTHRDKPDAVLWLSNYYFVRHNDEALLANCRRARAEKVAIHYALNTELSVLYARKEFDAALKALRDYDPADTDIFLYASRGYVLAAMPGRQAEAERVILEAFEKCPNGSALSFAPADILILGPASLEKSKQMALDIRKRAATAIPVWRNRWYHHLLDYHAHIIDADELLRRAGENRFNRCEGHFYVGLRKLAEGKRAEAKVCFQQSVDSGIFFFIEYIWSRAFLAHIDDPTWPPWRGAKK
jgi:serine/threonine protein kinase